MNKHKNYWMDLKNCSLMGSYILYAESWVNRIRLPIPTTFKVVDIDKSLVQLIRGL